MKTIRLILTICCAVAAVSCLDKFDNDANRGVSIAKLEPMTDYQVPVKEGFTTLVTLDGQEIARTRSALTISVPAYAATTRAEASGLVVSYTPNDQIFDTFGYASFWHYLSFEDSRKGDYDFNDVVMHCMVKSEVPWDYDGTQLCTHKVYLQPVALGGATQVGFGFLYRDDNGKVQEQLVTDDVRRDLFNNDPTFPINTDPNKPMNKITNYLKKAFECQTHKNQFPIVWFVANGKDRLFAATTSLGADRWLNMVNTDGIPYGIALTRTWCYPIEKVNIREAYPHFDEWLRNGDQELLLQDRVRDNVYLKAVIKDGANGSLWDYSGYTD